jgi:hypothetical protein
MQGRGDFAHGASESVHGDDDKLITVTEPAHALRPTRSVAPGASGGGVGKHAVGCDARRRNGVVLLVDGLLSGGHPQVSGGAHIRINHRGPTILPVSDLGKVGITCDTGKSDSVTCADLISADTPCLVPDV